MPSVREQSSTVPESASLYLLLKALHVAAAITFVGGVLAAAMLLGAIRGLDVSSRDGRRVVQRLHRWQRSVTTPAMLVVWGLGMILAIEGGWFAYPWLQLKLVLVVLLSALHGVQSGMLRRSASGAVLRSGGTSGFVPLTIGLVAGIAILVIALHGKQS